MKTAADVLKAITPVLPKNVAASFDPAKPFAAQGIDSLALTAMAVAVQNAFKVKIGVEDGLKMKSIDDVVAFLNKA